MLTASDAAKVLGVSPYGGPIDVWLEKTGRDIATEETPAMRRGRRREALVLAHYADAENVTLLRGDGFDITRHPHTPLIGATLDAVRLEAGDVVVPVEAKTARWADPALWGADDTDEIPVHYAVQVAVQVACVRGAVAHVPVEFAGDEYRRYVVPVAPSTSEAIVEKLLAWWHRHVETDTPPPPSPGDGYKDWLARCYPAATRAEPLRIDDHGVRLLGLRYDEIRGQVKVLIEAQDQIKHELCALMGDHDRAIADGWSASWKRAKDSQKFDAAAAFQAARRRLEELGEGDLVTALIAKHTTTSPGVRRFLLNVQD
jgi:putative phage-type endonuclease